MKAHEQTRILLVCQVIDDHNELPHLIGQMLTAVMNILLVENIVSAQLVIGIGNQIENLVVQLQTFFEVGKEYFKRNDIFFLGLEKLSDPVQEIFHCLLPGSMPLSGHRRRP